MSEHIDDPFAEKAKTPAVSFKDAPIGTTYTGTVTRKPELVQQRDYDTEELAWWDDAKTQPKMAVVTNLTIDGEERSLWAPKYPKYLFDAIAKAQKDAGALIDVGGTLTVKLSGEKPDPTKPKKAPAKLYEVTYSPPVVDAFADASTANDEPPF